MNLSRSGLGSVLRPPGRWGAGAVLLAAAMLTGACDEPPAQIPAQKSVSGRDKSLGFIAFVGAGEHDPLWPILKRGAERYTARLADVEVRCLTPSRRSVQEQIEVLGSLGDPDLRGLCIHSIDPNALIPVLEQMFGRGIMIVSIIEPVPQRLRVAHVGFDDAEIGRALAELTGKMLNGTGSIMVLSAGHDHPIYGPRLIAFEKQLREYPEIAVFAQVDCDADALKARNEVRQRSKRFPRLSAWVALDDWPIRDLGLDGSLFPATCRFVTFGGGPTHWPLIERGISPGIVAANYRELGARAVRFCESAINRPSRFKNNYTAPLRTLWPTNLEQYKRDWTYWSTGEFPQAEPGQ